MVACELCGSTEPMDEPCTKRCLGFESFISRLRQSSYRVLRLAIPDGFRGFTLRPCQSLIELDICLRSGRLRTSILHCVFIHFSPIIGLLKDLADQLLRRDVTKLRQFLADGEL